MIEKIAIKDTLTDSYFQGSNPNPTFSNEPESIRFFDSKEEAMNRMKEEFRLCPQDLVSRALEFISVYVF